MGILQTWDFFFFNLATVPRLRWKSPKSGILFSSNLKLSIRLNHNFCYTMTKNFKFIFLYLCLTSVNKICTIVINNVLPANREIIDALLVEVWRFLVEESLKAAFEVIVVFELPSVEEVAQRPE